MPTIQNTVSPTTGLTIADILVNNVLAILPRRSRVSVALVASATGLLIDVNVGTRQIAPSMIPSEANRVPVIPDDIQVRFIAEAGERIIIRVVNPTGGTIRLNYAVIIEN